MHSMNRHPPSTLKFRQLEYFVAEAEESKLTHAAGRLPASPTAVQQANLTLSFDELKRYIRALFKSCVAPNISINGATVSRLKNAKF
jgi:hypothetical protein